MLLELASCEIEQLFPRRRGRFYCCCQIKGKGNTKLLIKHVLLVARTMSRHRASTRPLCRNYKHVRRPQRPDLGIEHGTHMFKRERRAFFATKQRLARRYGGVASCRDFHPIAQKPHMDDICVPK